jgi:hypothetical protein
MFGQSKALPLVLLRLTVKRTHTAQHWLTLPSSRPFVSLARLRVNYPQNAVESHSRPLDRQAWPVVVLAMKVLPRLRSLVVNNSVLVSVRKLVRLVLVHSANSEQSLGTLV